MLVVATPAAAHELDAGVAVERGADRGLTLPRASCPPGVPAQTITVVDQAHVRWWALELVEDAVAVQSLQVRGAWGTPCVRFAPGGWRLYLKVGAAEPHGEHDFSGEPYALVWTAGGGVESWSRDFSHEVVEMLEDPTLDVRYAVGGVTWEREIADPVEGLGYRLDRVYVSLVRGRDDGRGHHMPGRRVCGLESADRGTGRIGPVRPDAGADGVMGSCRVSADDWRTIRHAGRPRREARPSAAVEQGFADEADAKRQDRELERAAELARRVAQADRLIEEALNTVRAVAPPDRVGSMRGADYYARRARALLRSLSRETAG